MTRDGHMPSSVSNDHADQRDSPNASDQPAPDAENEEDADFESDESPAALRRELRRRIAGTADPSTPKTPEAGSSTLAPGTPSVSSVGRHARRDGQSRPPRLDYVPRHAIHTPGPGSVSATELTEVFSRVRQDPTEAPRPARPESEPLKAPTPPQPAPEPEEAEQSEPEAEPVAPGKRVRVVLAQRKGHARPVRTVVDVQELTQVGEVLSTSLIRSQLALALRIGGMALIALGSLPAMFVVFPVLGRFELFGLRLPWLLLGVLAYPFLLALGWMYARSAERLEQVFADHIQS